MGLLHTLPPSLTHSLTHSFIHSQPPSLEYRSLGGNNRRRPARGPQTRVLNRHYFTLSSFRNPGHALQIFLLTRPGLCNLEGGDGGPGKGKGTRATGEETFGAGEVVMKR